MHNVCDNNLHTPAIFILCVVKGSVGADLMSVEQARGEVLALYARLFCANFS